MAGTGVQDTVHTRIPTRFSFSPYNNRQNSDISPALHGSPVVSWTLGMTLASQPQPQWSSPVDDSSASRLQPPAPSKGTPRIHHIRANPATTPSGPEIGVHGH